MSIRDLFLRWAEGFGRSRIQIILDSVYTRSIMITWEVEQCEILVNKHGWSKSDFLLCRALLQVITKRNASTRLNK
jgi:hypothetical protein